jgi:YHS domain-containing protein
MEVDPENAAGVRLVEGETYFLCSATCLAAFDQNAATYTERRESTHRRHHMGC